MDSLLFHIDSILAQALGALLLWLVAASMLQLACRICSISRPDLWQAMLAVAIVVGVNLMLLECYDAAGIRRNLATGVAVPLVFTAAVLGFTVRAKPLGAALVTLTHLALLGMGYGALQVAQCVLMPHMG